MADVVIADQRRLLLAWLRAREAGEGAELRETHVSIVAFAADRVWKCKKAIRYPFVDLSTLDRRLANCKREVELNRRLAPDVYLGVVPLVDNEGAVVDYLVEMRRLPEDCRLSAVAADARLGAGCIDQIADVLVPFHSTAPPGSEIDQVATPTALQSLWARKFGRVGSIPSNGA